jgi:3-octaprenyl-4-hydroxybenzoate carboxy-lyase
MGYYKDVREHLAALEAAGLLVRVDREINKDTELNPLVRLQFRGLPEGDRKAFLFTNVTDVCGRQFSIPVVVGCLAASRRIYGMGLQCDPAEIAQQWAKARGKPIEPVVVESDFYPGFRCGALYHLQSMDNKRSGDWSQKYRYLPGHGQIPYAARNECRRLTAHFSALAEMAEARQAHACRGCDRRASECGLRVRDKNSLRSR